MVHVEEVDGNKRVAYTQEERDKALSYFVTSTTDSIYAFRHNVPPEVFGAFASFFSRNPRDLREHLFDAIIGNIFGHKLSAEQGAENLQKLVNGDYSSPAEALEAGLAKAQEFYGMWYGKFNHRSIANVVWIPMVMTGISQPVARQIAYDQLAFFIEQSTRFVKFDTGEFFKSPEVMGSSLSDTYIESIETLTDAYLKLMDLGKRHYQREIPFDKWIEMQDDETLQSKPKQQKIKYKREINGKVFDDVRFLLPQAIQTNIAFDVDARSLELDIAAWKGHPLSEVRESAELLEKHGKIIAPSLFPFTARNEHYSDMYHEYHGNFSIDERIEPTTKHANILSYDSNLLDTMVALVLRKCNTGTFAPYLKRARQMSLGEKIGVIERIVANRTVEDEWVGVEETFDVPKVTVELVTDVGATRDLRRHQKNDRDEARYTLDMGFTIPPAIEDGYGQEAKEIFVNAMETAHKAEIVIRKRFPHEAQYVIPMACNHSFIMSLGIDQLQYFMNQRTTLQGNWSYRKDMFNLAEQILQIYPWLVGYEEYPEGQTILEAYANAPFTQKLERAVVEWQKRKIEVEAKGKEFTELMPHPAFVRLRTGETGLHQ